MILAMTLRWAVRDDGWLHLVDHSAADAINILHGPLGMLVGLIFVPFYMWIPASRRTHYLALTSLFVSLVTLGHAFTLTFACLVGLTWWIVRTCHRPERKAWGGVLLAALLAAWIALPRPFWLPNIAGPYHTFLHWAGIAYLFLRAYHVLAEVASQKMARPKWDEYVAYLLFLPTVRMGPIQRFQEFHAQLQQDPRPHLRFKAAGERFFTGALRMAAVILLTTHLPLPTLYKDPESLSNVKLILHLYAAPFQVYFFISAYADFSIALGYLMGFRIPDNFNYCWISTSIDEFWRRWHITLGSWLRDYLFTPMIRHRIHYFWAFVGTFMFCGIWHGQYLSYLLWGLSQGVGMGVRRAWNGHWRRLCRDASPFYLRLKRLGLVQSRRNTLMSWFVCFHYQILTMVIFGFEAFGYPRLIRRVVHIFGIEVLNGLS